MLVSLLAVVAEGHRRRYIKLLRGTEAVAH